MLSEDVKEIFDTEDDRFEITDGGAAAAFVRIKFECLSDQQISNIKKRFT